MPVSGFLVEEGAELESGYFFADDLGADRVVDEGVVAVVDGRFAEDPGVTEVIDVGVVIALDGRFADDLGVVDVVDRKVVFAALVALPRFVRARSRPSLYSVVIIPDFRCASLLPAGRIGEANTSGLAVEGFFGGEALLISSTLHSGASGGRLARLFSWCVGVARTFCAGKRLMPRASRRALSTIPFPVRTLIFDPFSNWRTFDVGLIIFTGFLIRLYSAAWANCMPSSLGSFGIPSMIWILRLSFAALRPLKAAFSLATSLSTSAS